MRKKAAKIGISGKSYNFAGLILKKN